MTNLEENMRDVIKKQKLLNTDKIYLQNILFLVLFQEQVCYKF